MDETDNTQTDKMQTDLEVKVDLLEKKMVELDGKLHVVYEKLSQLGSPADLEKLENK
jgi:hypothetical protein